MRVTVKIGAVEVTVDRPRFNDEGDPKGRQNRMNDTVIPTLNEAVNKAKELYQLLPLDKKREYKSFDEFPAPPSLLTGTKEKASSATCATCYNRKIHDDGKRVIHFCGVRTSNLSENGKLIINASDPACGQYAWEG